MRTASAPGLAEQGTQAGVYGAHLSRFSRDQLTAGNRTQASPHSLYTS